MNGFIKRIMALVCAGGVATIVAGCCGDKRLCDCYDNCWLHRYGYQAEQSVLQTFGAQVNNGHVLDQTVWSYHFEPGTANLTQGGLDHLSYLARRRPEPDPKIYLQTAQDVKYDPAGPEKFATDRGKLDEARKEAILRYLTAETAGRPVAFEVAVHDPSSVGMPAPFIGRAYDQFIKSPPQGVMPSTGVGGGMSGGGVSGGGSGGGGGGGAPR
jgi:hypothetical protein